MASFRIYSLLWHEHNEQKLAGHGVAPEDVEDLLTHGDWIALRNKKEHPPSHKKLVGRCTGGSTLVVIIRPTAMDGDWEPRTAWWVYPGDSEYEHYENQRKR